MWLLYSLKKNALGEYYEQIVSRLRPQQAYVIFRKDKFDATFQATIETDPFPESDVVDPKSKPVLRLTQIKSNRYEALVGDRTIGTDYFLHDHDVVRLSGSDIRFRIRWEDMVVFKDGPADDDYEDMVEEASQFGFHVTKEWHKNVTHVWISDSPKTEISTYLIKALMQKKFIITKKWIQDVFLQSEDRRFVSKTLDETIERIVWNNFGPLKRPAILSIDHRRSTLFEAMQFISFERNQTKRLSQIVSLGKGKVVYYDLSNQYEIDIGHNTIFIAPSEEEPQNVQRWEALKSRFYEQSGSLREIQEVEIGYAIVYCSTNYMCNPVTSLTSLNLDSLDTTALSDITYPKEELDNKPDKPYCSNAHPNTYSDINLQETHVSNEYTDSDDKPERPACYSETNRRDTRESNEQYESIPSPEYVRTNEPAKTEDTGMSPMAAMSPTDAMSPMVPMSPLEAMSPLNEADDDVMPLPSLDNIFNDFAGSLNPLPPPKKPVVEASSYTNAPDARNPTSPNEPTAHDYTTDLAPTRSTPIVARTPSPLISSSVGSLDDSSSAVRSPTAVRNPLAASSISPDFHSSVPNLPGRVSSSLLTCPDPSSVNGISSFAATHNTSGPSTSASPVTRTLPLRPTKRVIPVSETGRPQKRKKTMAEFGRYDDEEQYTEPSEQENQDKKTCTRIVFAPLVVNPNPPAPPQETSGGVNFKRFKKVRQFENANFMDIVSMVSSTQRAEEQRIRANQPRQTSRGNRAEDSPDYDPDIQITSVRQAARW